MLFISKTILDIWTFLNLHNIFHDCGTVHNIHSKCNHKYSTHKMHSLLKLHLLIFKAGIVISTTNCLINCLILRKIKVVLKLTNKMNEQRNENKDVYMQ